VLSNKELLLKPGMLLQLELIHAQREALVIPEESVIALKDSHYVYVVDAENRVSRKEIIIGLRKPGIAEVLSGLNEGEQIVTQGLLKVREGATVTLQTEQWRNGGAA
jgi:membrane fusion protein (multidrug efflux system)